MECRGIFKFKCITERSGGSFTNDKGDVINYKSCYKLKVDELAEDNKIYEREFKLNNDSPLISELAELKPYTDIEIKFDVAIYGSRITATPVAISY